MMEELANLPPSIWHQNHLEHLSVLIKAALNAADLSYNTSGAIERLIRRLLPFHPQWAANSLARLVQERGYIGCDELRDSLASQDLNQIAPVLLPVFQSWATREREAYLIEACRNFGIRLKLFDGLVDLLEQLISSTKSDWIASSALSIIQEHRQDRLPTLIPQLIAADPSWVTQPVVYNYLHRRRQDLLTPFLGRKAYQGRFSTGKTIFVLPINSDFYSFSYSHQYNSARTTPPGSR